MRFRSFLVAGASALAIAGLPTLPAGAGSAPSVEFDYTGEEATWVVPDDVCEVDALATGASGGDGPAEGQSGAAALRPPVPSTGPGGIGGMVQGTIEVTPGETLSINVGGPGLPGQSLRAPIPTGGAGGFNGGGDGGDAEFGTGGGGGGATDIRQGGNGLSHRVLVAGGGGGSGAFSYQYDVDDLGDAVRIPSEAGLGGFGGGDNTPDGTDGLDANGGATGGDAGTTGNGGSGGVGHPDGNDGVQGDGGSAGSPSNTYGGGGGGGGGYFGGGAGGGGENDFDGATVPDRVHASFEGAGGGGGSSFGPNGTLYSFALGPGDGSLFLTWVEDPGCDTVPTTTTTVAPTTTAAAAKPQALTPSFTG